MFCVDVRERVSSPELVFVTPAFTRFPPRLSSLVDVVYVVFFRDVISVCRGFPNTDSPLPLTQHALLYQHPDHVAFSWASPSDFTATSVSYKLCRCKNTHAMSTILVIHVHSYTCTQTM